MGAQTAEAGGGGMAISEGSSGRGAAAEPGDAAADSGGSYTLLHPTPRGQMREMSTDRPDTTESPISVDAGHVQIEMDAVSVARDQGVTDLALATLNLKLGLTS